jgi:hypothetical protein
MRRNTKLLSLIAAAIILIAVQITLVIEIKMEQKQEQSVTNEIIEEPQIIQEEIVSEDELIRLKMEKFIETYGSLNKQQIKILLDTLEENSEEPLIMLAIYKQESKFKMYANSYCGAEFGRGVGQVSEIGLTDYNWKNGTDYKPEDLYDIRINVIVSCWIYEYNEKYGVYGTNKKIIAYNEGHVYAKKKSKSAYLDKVNDNMLLFEEM